MLKTYKEYQNYYIETNQRCDEKLKQNEYLIHPNVDRKISKDGTLKYFNGDTLIFDLPEELKEECYRLQKELYNSISKSLSVKLSKKLFHMTAHQLYNPYLFNFGQLSENEQILKMDDNLKKYNEIIKKYDINTSIKLKIHSVVCDRGLGVLVLLMPVDEESFNLLQNLHTDFENILNFDLGIGYMHVTLAYFKPIEKLENDEFIKLKNYIDNITFTDKVYELPLSNLNYVRFTNMDDFHTV